MTLSIDDSKMLKFLAAKLYWGAGQYAKSNAISFQDVLQSITLHFLLTKNYQYAYRDTFDEMDQLYYTKNRRKYWEQIDTNDEFNDDWYYALMVIDGVDDDIINKIWYEQYSMQHDERYISIVDLLMQGYRQKEIAEKLAVHESRISQLLKNRPKREEKKPVYYLGHLCRHNHDHDNTGKSLRYISTDRCVECMKCLKK